MKKLPLLISLVLFIGNLQAQITAEFTSLPFDNCGGISSPVNVSFLDQSTSSGGVITNWNWDFGDLQTSPISSPTHTYLLAGNYTVCLTVTNIANDSDTECKTNYVSISEIPVCTILPPDNINCVNSIVTIDGGLSSIGANIVYEWRDANFNILGFNPTLDVSAAGSYTLNVSETVNGCSAETTVEVIENITPPIADAGPDQVLNCNTISVTLGGTNSSSGSNFAYEWFGPNLNPISLTLNPEVSQPGIYTLIVTDVSNGCTASDEVIVTEDTSIPVINISATTLVCPGELVMIDMLPPCVNCSVEIFDAMGNQVCTTGLPCEIDPADEPFQIIVTDLNNGCQNVENLTFSNPNPIEITSAIITNISCISTDDGAIDITSTGGTPPYAHLWSDGQSSEDISNLSVGIYTLTITDVNGCSLVSPEYTVIQNSCFDFSNDTTICVGGTAILSNESPTSGWNYTWAPATGINNPNIPNPIAAPSETTTYFLTITDGGGTVIFSGEGPTVTVQNYLDFGLLNFSNSPLCEGDTLELYGNIGLIFAWSGPNSFLSNEMDPTINNVSASQSGIYSLLMTDEFGCTATADVDVFIDDDCVWPGDTDTNLVVNHFDLLNIGLAYDSVGTTRENASFDWFGQPSVDWSQSTPTSNVNYKHIDADGNGIIEAADTVAITQNFGLTHNFGDPIDNQFTDLPPTDGFTVVTPFYVEPDTLIEGETIALDIILGDVSNVVMGLYGIGFSIEYDSSVVVPGSAHINFDNCWLGDVNADAISIQFDFPNPGRIDAAITRIDGMEMDGYGLFGELIITLEDDILLWNGNSNNFTGTTKTDVTADFTITNYHLINFSQEEIIVQGMTTTAPIGETTSLSFVELNELITVFPNPAVDGFFIASQKIDIERVRIFSTTGELKYVKTKTGNNLEFSTKGLASGIYFIEIQTREGIVTKKLIVQ